ncbi:unnamed protein product, partial [Staurois parvus]
MIPYCPGAPCVVSLSLSAPGHGFVSPTMVPPAWSLHVLP